ncbi:MAG: methyltransferase domain-containing protein [Euryarchaeota archaeon]|nr:methyltransferase domain-containing protein [Euryarchaeota archaeon]MDE1835113.1 methyltransferase domain-containing protein [Euryarchaeota archaeon]MDE2044924.1 methyltransferase domain-containing protein [Thermoplasmata archaeon]
MAEAPTMDLSVSTFFPLPASQVFSSLVEELALALGGVELKLEPKKGGRLLEAPKKGRPTEVARILAWDPGEGIRFRWHPPTWAKNAPTEVEVRLAPEQGGTRVTIEHRGFGHGLLSEEGEELVGWFASEVATTLFRATSPARLGDWVTDRHARRPSGRAGRETYRDPLYHRPNFAAILERLSLTKQDDLLEVGCGGGAFLQDALKSGCRAAAIDHSLDLLRVAEEMNQEAIAQDRLELVHSEADRIPFADGRFTRAVMTGVLGFLPDAPATFREMFRTLAPGGRVAVYTTTEALRGTPADPEPIASRVRYYSDRELAALAKDAGFTGIKVEHPDLTKFAKVAGVPLEAIPVFKGHASQLLWATKPTSRPVRPGTRPSSSPPKNTPRRR